MLAIINGTCEGYDCHRPQERDVEDCYIEVINE
jgi:hypothetical protein